MNELSAFIEANSLMLLEGIRDTLYMTFVSTFAAYIFGIPIGILAEVTRKGGLHPMPLFNGILGWIINIGRSIPFIILFVAVMPFTRKIVGTTIGPKAATVALIIAAVPFVARLVENSLLEVDSGTIEAAEAMGATSFQIIWYFLLPEAMGSLVLSLTTATIGLVGATAMAGTIGGGGIGDVAISYGYERFDTEVMIITVILLIVFVQLIQTIGNTLSRKVRRH